MTDFQTVFFDLDDTLYSPESGVWDAIGERINLFMIERVGLHPREVSDLRRDYFIEHGTTLNGLILYHQVDPDEYMSYVHDIPIEEYLSEDQKLRRQLELMPQKRIVMTNASSSHATRVLEALGIAEQMNLVLDLFALDLINKPNPEAYQIAIELSGVDSARTCLYVDDQERNLSPAKALGMTTVLAHNPSLLHQEDYSISTITELVEIVPGLQTGS
jgi:putative hydrolase of the HAD superfamily